jgi:SAM-dependent methyltransferase
MELVLLEERQNEAFDSDYHQPGELAQKIAQLKARFGQRPISILDLGGGNGRFLDTLLAALPQAGGVVLDISDTLLARNRPDPRKTLVKGSISDMRALLGDRKFDVITINWVLHHLVGTSYADCTRNAIECLKTCTDLLTPDGVIVVAENLYDSPMGGNLPSHVIFGLSAMRWKPALAVTSRFFNTAGVGVCFRSQSGWQALFGDAGLARKSLHYGRRWGLPTLKRVAFFLLGGAGRPRHGHFYLQPSR